MKIALVYPHILGSGGYPRDFRWLAGHLEGQGAKVTVFAENPESLTNLTDGLSPGVTVDQFAKNANRELKQLEAFDVVHFVGFFFPTYLSYLRRLRKPVIVLSTLGHLMPLHLQVKRLKKALFIKTAGRFIASRVLSFHVFSKTEAMSLSIFGKEPKYFIAPLGVYPSGASFAHLEREPRNNEEFSLLFFGRNDVMQKGIDLLLHSFAMAVKNIPHGITLTIAGRPWKNSEAQIYSLINQLGIQNHIKVLGSVNEETKNRLLVQHDYLCFLSRWDGPPRPVREAIALGTPVIVSYETNMGKLVADAGAGVSVSLEVKCVAEVLKAVKGDRSLVYRHREGARILANRLSWDKVARIFIAAYEDLVARAR